MSIIKQAFAHKRKRPNLTSVTSGYTGVGDGSYDVSIKPSNDYISVGADGNTHTLSVWSWNGSSTISEVAYIDSTPDVYSCTWHPTTSHIAVNFAAATDTIAIYSFTGGNTLTKVASANVSGAVGWSTSWHPSGNYVALAAYNTTAGIKVFSWNGTDTLTEVESLTTTAYQTDVVWSPDGTYLGTTHSDSGSSKGITIYSWNGTDTLTAAGTYSTGTTQPGYGMAWTSDNKYIFIANDSTTSSLYLFSYNGSALTLKQTINASMYGYDTDIFKDRLIAAVFYATSAASAAYLKLYHFDRVTETITLVSSFTSNTKGYLSVDFNDAGTYLAIGTNGETNKSLYIISVY